MNKLKLIELANLVTSVSILFTSIGLLIRNKYIVFTGLMIALLSTLYIAKKAPSDRAEMN